MTWWTDRKIEYFNRAARLTDFHRILADEIERHISKSDRIIEYGAGLGYTTEILWKDGYNIRGIENDDRAIESANGRIGYPLIEKGDAYGEIEESDVILMVFFGRLKEDDNLSHFIGKAPKIINISGCHRGYALSKRKDDTKELSDLLDALKLPYETVELEAEFNQPFKDMAEALEWFKLTYGSDEIRGIRQTGREDFPIEFVNRKRTVMTVINTEKGEDNEE